MRRGRRTIPTTLAGLVLLAALTLLHPLLRKAPPGQDDYIRYHNQTFTVADVVDGDTLDLDTPDGRHGHTRVRLWGVDTPETVDPRKAGADYFGPEASAFTKKTATGQAVRLELVQGKVRDKYDRLLAYIYLPDGSMLNERIIEGGLGYADTRFAHPYMARFRKLESKAARGKAGLWEHVQPDQMPAWRQQAEKQN